MSIVCAAIKGSEIAIAADSLTKYGALSVSSGVMTNTCKLYEVNDSIIGLVGWCSISTIFEHLVTNQGKLFRLHNRMEILATLLRLHEKMKGDYYLNTYADRDQPVESSQLHMLIANPHGLFLVSSSREVSEFKTYFALGSGRRVAPGAMHVLYNGRKSAGTIVEAGVRAAAEFEDSCGLPLYSGVVQPGTKQSLVKKRRGSARRDNRNGIAISVT